MSVATKELVDSQRAGATQDKRRKGSEIEQADFIAGGPELRSRRRDRAKLDGAEAERKMDGDRRDQQNRPERHADDGKPCACQHGKPSDEFNNNRRPRHCIRGRNAERVKGSGEVVRAVHHFRVPVSDEAIAHDQPQGEGRPAPTL